MSFCRKNRISRSLLLLAKALSLGSLAQGIANNEANINEKQKLCVQVSYDL
jgi:hypothetical protein